MSVLDLDALTASSLAALLRSGEVSPVEAVEAYLTRIAEADPLLHAYITLCGDRAVAEAREAERIHAGARRDRPLHGVPYAVKDQIETAGVRTTMGVRALADNVPTEDATVVSRLRAAGAILLGKLNLTQLATAPQDDYPFGEPRNPWDLSRAPGASSGGSAIAVAASLAAFALGEDTGGSVRGPAAHCGIVGLRPTWGLVPREGVLECSPSMDTAGPMTRTVEDVELVLGAIADRALDRPASVRGLRAVVIEEWMDPSLVDAEVIGAVRAACDVLVGLGAFVDSVSWPRCDDAAAVFAVLSQSDAAFAHRALVRERGDGLGDHVRRRLLAASLLPPSALVRAATARDLIRDDLRRLLGRWDLIVSAAIARPAPPISHLGAVLTLEEAERAFDLPRIERHVAALAGVPAMSVPCGATDAGLPIGLQLMGDTYQEGTLIAIGRAYQAVTEWHRRRPPRMSASSIVTAPLSA